MSHGRSSIPAGWWERAGAQDVIEVEFVLAEEPRGGLVEPTCPLEPLRISAVVTEIWGDREHMGGLTPRPGAFRHLAALASADISASPSVARPAHRGIQGFDVRTCVAACRTLAENAGQTAPPWPLPTDRVPARAWRSRRHQVGQATGHAPTGAIACREIRGVTGGARAFCLPVNQAV
ncbi:hypothetical protein SKAU_G00384110 [Synaphobranchus kaupii]|uniref:Uncharacterized protein n=1 Tax=Synaphobranchus kaupii TaxID=118154 RepID=A0A9Q1EE94_SYNKA|nr:hypothetical protein SKAU_G00384110 [Synaphobranchus kaupii]